jgi:hypothetical protein
VHVGNCVFDITNPLLQRQTRLLPTGDKDEACKLTCTSCMPFESRPQMQPSSDAVPVPFVVERELKTFSIATVANWPANFGQTMHVVDRAVGVYVPKEHFVHTMLLRPPVENVPGKQSIHNLRSIGLGARFHVPRTPCPLKLKPDENSS